VHDLERRQPAAAEPIAAATSSPAWSRDRLAELGVTTDLMTAARMLGIGRTTAYKLARTGTFPVPAVRIGRNYRIPVARVVELLGLDKEPHA
jgi:excisionase family DNA binding protein